MGNYTGLQTNFQKFEQKRTLIQYEPEMCWEIQNKTVNALMKVSKLNDKIIFCILKPVICTYSSQNRFKFR